MVGCLLRCREGKVQKPCPWEKQERTRKGTDCVVLTTLKGFVLSVLLLNHGVLKAMASLQRGNLSPSSKLPCSTDGQRALIKVIGEERACSLLSRHYEAVEIHFCHASLASSFFKKKICFN